MYYFIYDVMAISAKRLYRKLVDAQKYQDQNIKQTNPKMVTRHFPPANKGYNSLIMFTTCVFVPFSLLAVPGSLPHITV